MDGENKPTTKFLLARITALRFNLVRRLETIFAAALQTIPVSALSDPTDLSLPRTLIETATEQFQLDVESTALVRAAEEIMVLTRVMKDLWLFGRLDTIPHPGAGAAEDDAADRQLKADQKLVEEALQKYLTARTQRRLDGDVASAERMDTDIK